MMPLISVILPVRNGADFLEECLNSVFSQTFQDFECIIVNDGSTDSTSQILGQIKDPRVRSFELNPGVGVPEALNAGIEQSCGKYLARVDADDVLDLKRFERQIEFMEKNPDVGVLGSWASCFGSNKTFIQPPADHDSIAGNLLFDTALFHPTVMIRRSVCDNQPFFYNARYRYTEDVELWQRLVHKTRFANLQESLVLRRLHRGMSSHRNKSKMIHLIFKLRKQLVSELVLNPEECGKVLNQLDEIRAKPKDAFSAWAGWFKRLERAMEPSAFWSKEQARRKVDLWRQDLVVSLHLLKKKYAPGLFWKYAFDAGRPWRYVSWKRTALFFVKCMVFWRARPYV